jgi:hypothetical protein
VLQQQDLSCEAARPKQAGAEFADKISSSSMSGGIRLNAKCQLKEIHMFNSLGAKRKLTDGMSVPEVLTA